MQDTSSFHPRVMESVSPTIKRRNLHVLNILNIKLSQSSHKNEMNILNIMFSHHLIKIK